MKNNQKKRTYVNSVFTDVHKKYDLMNDVMSVGVHRLWKKELINMINPQKGENLIDVASGSGDIAKLYNKRTKNKSKICCVDQNSNMVMIGKKRTQKYNNISWHISSAEKLPFKDDTFDYYTISFGIRNVIDIDETVREALRVLKVGGRFCCLEFSKVDNQFLNSFYKSYSKVIPYIGKLITGKSDPYKYLISSIEKFHDQQRLSEIVSNAGFENVKYTNLSAGIAALHSGWKI